MSWTRSLIAGLIECRPHQQANVPSPHRGEQGNDIFAELIAASSLLDFGATLPEPKLRETDLDRSLRPW